MVMNHQQESGGALYLDAIVCMPMDRVPSEEVCGAYSDLGGEFHSREVFGTMRYTAMWKDISSNKCHLDIFLLDFQAYEYVYSHFI